MTPTGRPCHRRQVPQAQILTGDPSHLRKRGGCLLQAQDLAGPGWRVPHLPLLDRHNPVCSEGVLGGATPRTGCLECSRSERLKRGDCLPPPQALQGPKQYPKYHPRPLPPSQQSEPLRRPEDSSSSGMGLSSGISLIMCGLYNGCVLSQKKNG